MRVTAWRTSSALASPIRAAAQRHDVREHLFVSIEDGGAVGFGEVSPQPTPINGDPSLDSVVIALREEVLRRLATMRRASDRPPAWAMVHQAAGPRSSSVVAWSLIEMALIDLSLRVEGRALDDLWPSSTEPATMGTVSLLDDEPWMVDRDVARVRAKLRPGALNPGRMDRLAGLERPVIIDYNCSGTSVDDVLRDLDVLMNAVPVVAVEQPFEPGNLITHAELAARRVVDVSLDEGVRSMMDLRRIERYRAASMICVKPARLGGLAVARTVIEAAKAAGIRPYVGGFFESPLARSVHRRLAAAFVVEPSDVGTVASDSAGLVGPVAGGFGLAPFRAADDVVCDVEL